MSESHYDQMEIWIEIRENAIDASIWYMEINECSW